MVKAMVTPSKRRCSKCGSTWIRVRCTGRVSLYYDTETADLLDELNLLDEETLRVEMVHCMECGETSAPLEAESFGAVRLFLAPPPKVPRQQGH